MSRFRFVEAHRDAYGVKRLCRLAEVSRSGFYAWSSRPPSARAVTDLALLPIIVEIHDESRGTYGAPRVCGQVRKRDGWATVNHKRVARIMRDHGIRGVCSPKRRRGGGGPPPADDLIRRDFTAVEPNQRWVADMTEWNCLDGRLYLAGVMDLFARKIVGWSIGERRPAELAVDALVMAIGRREPPEGVVHHSDRGSPYTAMDLRDTATDAFVALSFGRVGTAADNAAMEAFWSTLKRELAHIHQRDTWTRAELRAALFDYIEVFYNRSRHQARLDHMTPTEFEAAHEAA